MNIYLIPHQKEKHKTKKSQIESHLLVIVTRNVVLRRVLNLHFISLSTLEVLEVNKMVSISSLYL